MKDKYTGLTEIEVLNNQKLYGKNVITYKENKTLLKNILKFLKYPTFLLLVILVILYIVLGEIIYATIISIISIIILISNIYQQIKLNKIGESLNKINQDKCRVIRDNKTIIINSDEVTIDDIIVLNEGDRVSADAIILESNDLYADESVLIKNNINVSKSYNLLDKDATLKSNYVYKETLITRGNGIAKVTNIGNKTEYGKIINLSKKENNSNLEKQINKLYKILTIISIITLVIVGVILIINNNVIIVTLSGTTILLTIFPIITPQTFKLIIKNKLHEIAKNKAIIKKISNIETISKITYLCVDKIGIVTENKMKVSEFYSTIDSKKAIFNCIMASDKNSKDTIDKAMFEFAYENNIELDKNFRLVKKYPFNLKNKMTANVYEYNNELYIYVKGALNSLFDICDLDVEEKYKLHIFQKQLYKKGLQVMAFASKKIDKIEIDIFKYNVDFNGILGLCNIVKSDVKEGIENCRQLGINVIMMTNDNKEISSSIGKQIKIDNYKSVVSGKELDDISDDELARKIKDIGIFSKLSEKHKLRIVNILKNNNEIVGITGYSVNDLKILKCSNVGMTISNIGTEVSKEFSDLIILDNNFKTIVNTIKDTRKINKNIKKIIHYLLTINIILILLSLITIIFNYQIFILPICVIIIKMILETIYFLMLNKNKCKS